MLSPSAEDCDYELSVDIPEAHAQDVKCVIVVPRLAYQDQAILFNLVSASRDKLVKLWSYHEAPETSEGRLRLACTFAMHQHFVNSLAWIPPIPELAEHGLIVSGGTDQLIHIYSPHSASNEPCYTLLGHTANVCSLCYDTFAPSALPPGSRKVRLLSGSWDATARLWTLHRETGLGSFTSVELRGHLAAVWATLFLPNGHILTGSADRTIRLWRETHCLYIFAEAHADVVRSLALLSPDGLLLASTGNDGKLAIWNMASQTQVKSVQVGGSFIYCLASAENGALMASGEEGLVTVWHWAASASATYRLELPCDSVWTVVALPAVLDADFAVGCNDGSIKLFTRDKRRRASESALRAFASRALSRSMSKRGALKSEPPSSLLEPGKTEGQKRIIKQVTQEGTFDLQVYSWSHQSSKWTLLGSVVDQPDEDACSEKAGTLSESTKVLGGGEAYKGQAYDYVFKIDVEDGRPPLDLPYNRKDNPYVAAQNFIAEHGLPISYLDQIVQFILQNSAANGSPPVSLSAQARSKASSAYKLFREYNGAGIMKKLREYNGQQSVASQYTSAELEAIEVALCSEHVEAGLLPSLLAKGLAWSLDSVFPILDLCRMALIWSPEAWQTDEIDSVIAAFQTRIMQPSYGGDPQVAQRNTKLAARFLVNLFHAPAGLAFILGSTISFLGAWRSLSPSNLDAELRAAFSHNYSVLAEDHSQLLSHLDQI